MRCTENLIRYFEFIRTRIMKRDDEFKKTHENDTTVSRRTVAKGRGDVRREKEKKRATYRKDVINRAL